MRRAVLLVVLLLGALAAAPARAEAPAEEARVVALANAERTAELRVAPDLVAFARRHSDRMIARGELYHSPDLATVDGWSVVGENVGRGASVEHVHQMLMASPTHRANIVDLRYTEVGVGVTWDGPMVYVTQIFRRPAAAPASRPFRPRPTTTALPPVLLPGRTLEAVVLPSSALAPAAAAVVEPAFAVTRPSPTGPAAVAGALVALALLGHALAARRRAAVR